MRSLLLALAVVLSIEPSVYRVTFPASDNNYSIVVVISSDTNGRAYYQYDEVPILDADQTVVEIPRHALPHGGYRILAMLMYWPEGAQGPIAIVVRIPSSWWTNICPKILAGGRAVIEMPRGRSSQP